MKDTPGLDVTAVIAAPAGQVLKAFFDAEALNDWWQVAHSVTTPRILGPYAIEWAPTDFRDDVLGRLGGVFRGTIVQFQAGEGFFVADVFWLPLLVCISGFVLLFLTLVLMRTRTEIRSRRLAALLARERVA